MFTVTCMQTLKELRWLVISYTMSFTQTGITQISLIIIANIASWKDILMEVKHQL